MRRTGSTIALPFEALESRKLLGADLALTLGAITISDAGTPAELVHVATTIANVGNAAYASGGAVHYFLSTDNSLSPDDFSWESRPLGNFNPGDTSTTSFDAMRPAPGALAAGNYFVIAALEFPPGMHDDFAGNDISATTDTLSILPVQPPPTTMQFGNVNGKHVVLDQALANGQKATFSLTGPGTGTLTMSGGQFTVSVDGSSKDSTLTVRSDTGAQNFINGVTINGTAQRIRLDHIAVNGNITVNGALKELNGDDITGGTVLITQAGRSSTDIRVHTLTDVTINSASAIRTLSLTSWNLGDASIRDALIAPGVDQLTTHGDFGADLSIDHGTLRGSAVNNIDIGGAITGGTWSIIGGVGSISANSMANAFAANITKDLKSVRVRGDASGSIAARNIDTLDFKGDVTGMTVLAGANLGSDAHMGGTGQAADTFAGGTIKQVKIGGDFTNSTIGAGVNLVDSALSSSDTFFSPSKIGRAKVSGTTTNGLFLASSVNGGTSHSVEHQNSQNSAKNEDEGSHNSSQNNNSQGSSSFVFITFSGTMTNTMTSTQTHAATIGNFGFAVSFGGVQTVTDQTNQEMGMHMMLRPMHH
jgi:hypothetical protein